MGCLDSAGSGDSMGSCGDPMGSGDPMAITRVEATTWVADGVAQAHWVQRPHVLQLSYGLRRAQGLSIPWAAAIPWVTAILRRLATPWFFRPDQLASSGLRATPRIPGPSRGPRLVVVGMPAAEDDSAADGGAWVVLPKKGTPEATPRGLDPFRQSLVRSRCIAVASVASISVAALLLGRE